MNMIQKKVIAGIGALGAASMLLAGCGGKDPVESLHDSMEKAVQAEKPFQKEQKTLEKLEKKKHKLYDSAVKLNMDDYQKIVTLSDQALSNANQRKKHLKAEKDSIDDSKKAFESAKKTSQEIKDKKVKEKAGHAVALMEKRYASYDLLYKKYEKAISLDKDLYKLIKDKKLTLAQLEEQISKVNSVYEKVHKQADEFNQFTKDYNKEKELLFRE